MPVPAGVIGYIHMAAAVLIPMPAKSSGPAYLDGVHGAMMIKRHPVGPSIVFTILTEDIGHLDAMTGRLHQSCRERLKLFGYTVQGTADLCKVHLADMQIDGRGLRGLVTQQQLNMMQAGPRFNQMGRKSVPERMWPHRFCYAGALLGFNEYIPYRGVADVGVFLLPFE
jgi:hypothetical protein